jgi:hypothetical protein
MSVSASASSSGGGGGSNGPCGMFNSCTPLNVKPDPRENVERAAPVLTGCDGGTLGVENNIVQGPVHSSFQGGRNDLSIRYVLQEVCA